MYGLYSICRVNSRTSPPPFFFLFFCYLPLLSPPPVSLSLPTPTPGSTSLSMPTPVDPSEAQSTEHRTQSTETQKHRNTPRQRTDHPPYWISRTTKWIEEVLRNVSLLLLIFYAYIFFLFLSVRYGDADGNAGMFFLDCGLGTTQVSERISSAQYKPNISPMEGLLTIIPMSCPTHSNIST